MSILKRPLFVALAIVAVAGGAGFLFWDRNRIHGDGPLDAGGLGYGQYLKVNEVFSFGQPFLRNVGKTPIVIDSVKLLGVTGALDLLGVATRPVPDERGKGMLLGDYGFPPPEYPGKPLTEQNVVPVPKTFTEDGHPDEGLQLIVGIRATKVGVAGYRAAQVSYHVGGRKYRETFESPIHLCASQEREPIHDTGCPGKELEDVFEDRTLSWPQRGAS